MIAILTCKCTSADTIGRHFLRDHGVGEWLSVPLYQGQRQCQEFLKTLPETAEGPDHQFPLWDFIGHASKFVIILGYSENGLMWSNIFTDSAKAQGDAEIILEQFANL